jgi:hypothetical protein
MSKGSTTREWMGLMLHWEDGMLMGCVGDQGIRLVIYVYFGNDRFSLVELMFDVIMVN